VAHPVEHALVVHQPARAEATREDEDVRVGPVLERDLGVQGEHPVVGLHRPGLEADELELGAREAGQDLVRADRVERGDLVEDWNGDLHATSSREGLKRLR
jgi:hypothetical protein